MEIDDKLLTEQLKEKQKSCSMIQLQALRTEMAQNQIITPKPSFVKNADKKEKKSIKKQGSQPKANSRIKSEVPEINQNIKYWFENSQFYCNECGDQSADFNWFAKHVSEHRREQMEIAADPLRIEDDLILNPWQGKDLSAFLKYCCPECEFYNDDLELFSEHAFQNHINANVLFSEEFDNELKTDIKIEYVEDNCFLETSNIDEKKDLDCIEKLNKKRSTKEVQKSTIKEQVLCEICPILDVTTSSLKLINSHRNKNHKNGKQFCCPHCDTTVSDWGKLVRHVSSNHQEHYEKKFFCNTCDKGFLFSSLYTNHKKFAHIEKEKTHTCQICGNHYDRNEQLKEHILLRHNFKEATKLFCDKCDYSTISKIILRRHIHSIHSKEKHKKCQYCEYTSPLNTKLHIHIDVNHPEKEEKNFLCEKCDKSFIYKATFTNHTKYKCKYSDYSEKRKEQKAKSYMKGKKLTKSKLFKCDYCEQALKATTLNKVNEHYNLKHSGKPIVYENHEKFVCSNCKDVFLFEDEFNCHKNLRHGIKTERNYCPKCKMSYVEIHKCQKGGHLCDKCEKIFSSRQHLIGHIKTEHDKQFDFECSTCGKKVGSNTKLLNHILQCHSKVKCEICSKEIANRYDLKRHKLAVHKDTTGVWLCEICPKSVFFTKSKFDKHVRDKHGLIIDQLDSVG